MTLKDLLEAGLLVVRQPLIYLREEGYVVSDGWIEYAGLREPDVESFCRKVCLIGSLSSNHSLRSEQRSDVLTKTFKTFGHLS